MPLSKEAEARAILLALNKVDNIVFLNVCVFLDALDVVEVINSRED